jgi:hypothetical protein
MASIASMSTLFGKNLPSTPEANAMPETQDFEFTRIIYITPHSSYTSKIKVHDLTNSISAAFTSELFPTETENTGKSLADASSLYTIIQPGWWRPSTIYPGNSDEKSDSDVLATWKPSRGSLASQIFTFPASSPHSSHNITLKRLSAPFRYAEVFVKDSVEYIWKFEGSSRRRITLLKKIGSWETTIAKYRGPYRFGKTGGTLVVNEAEVDILVAILTCCAELRKVRQRD